MKYVIDESYLLQFFERLRPASQFLRSLHILLGLFFFSNEHINLRNLIIHLPVTRLDLHIPLETPQSLCELASPFIQNPKIVMRDLVLGMNPQHFLIVLNRLFELACMMEDLRQSLQGQIVVWVNLERSLVVVGCLLEIFRVFVGSCQIVEVVSIMAVYLDGFSIIFYGFFVIFCRVVSHTESIVIFAESRIDLNSLPVIFDRLQRFFIKVKIAQVVVGMRILRKQLNSLQKILETRLFISELDHHVSQVIECLVIIGLHLQIFFIVLDGLFPAFGLIQDCPDVVVSLAVGRIDFNEFLVVKERDIPLMGIEVQMSQVFISWQALGVDQEYLLIASLLFLVVMDLPIGLGEFHVLQLIELMLLQDDLSTHSLIRLRFFLVGLLSVLDEIDLWHILVLQPFAASDFGRDGIIEVDLVDHLDRL